MRDVIHIPIFEWDDPDAHTKKVGMVRVPYMPIDEIVEELRILADDRGVMPDLLAPYRADDQPFNARNASVLSDRLPAYNVFMPISTSSRITLQDFVKATLKSGFNKLVVPYAYGYNGQYRFDSLMQFLHGIYDETTWFHVAGGRPEIPDSWSGVWSWSEEEL